MDKKTLDKDKWDKLFQTPQTKFDTKDFGVISFRKEFVQSLLIDIKDLTYNGFDNIDICYRGEGRGKSKFAAQKEYVRWHLLTELGLIDYEWDLEEVIYASIGDLLKALIRYIKEPYRIFILDESDELKRQNWNKPLVKATISYLRRGRKFFKIINFNIPNLMDLPEDIVTDRATKLYQIEMSRNFENFEFERGHAKMFEVPRADGCWSFAYKRIILESTIKNSISYQYRDRNRSYIVLPDKIKCLDINFNSVFPFNEDEYEEMMREKTADYFNNSLSNGFSENEVKVLNMIFTHLAQTKSIKTIFGEDESARRAYYRLKDNVNRIVGDK